MNSTETLTSYLTFRLGDELFAANVAKVLEILEIPRITKVPRSPDYMRGVVNLRGSVLPVIDARITFGLEHVEDTISTSIIVMDVNIKGQQVTIGTVVDAVHEVMEISEEEMQAAPSIGAKYKAEFVKGMVKVNDHFIMMLDLDLVFSASEAILLKDVVENIHLQTEE